MHAGKARPRSLPEQRAWPEFPPPDAVLEGLAVNPALPEELLVRLIREHGGPAATGLAERTPLPPAAVSAMAQHPQPWVRYALATNEAAGPDARLALLDDPDRRVRNRLVNARDLPLPERALRWVLERYERAVERHLLDDEELAGELIEEIARRPAQLLPVVVRHPDPRFRVAACVFVKRLAPELRDALLHDDSVVVRERTAWEIAELTRPRTLGDLQERGGHRRADILRAPLTEEALAWVLAEGDEYDLTDLAHNPHLPEEAVQALVTHRDPAARREAARRPDLTVEQALLLSRDAEREVRTEVSTHPVLTEEQRAAIDIDPDARHPNAQYPEPSPESLAAWATSVSPHLRRRAAHDRRLPADLVKRLADDPDHEVRVELGRRHADAPPETLLYSYLHLDRHAHCCRPRLLGRPAFPATGLAHFADDPKPHVRLLATRDPGTDPAVRERLLTDADASVRWAAARSPHLPARRIIALLDHPELCGAAAANTSLPIAEMARRLG